MKNVQNKFLAQMPAFAGAGHIFEGRKMSVWVLSKTLWMAFVSNRTYG